MAPSRLILSVALTILCWDRKVEAISSLRAARNAKFMNLDSAETLHEDASLLPRNKRFFSTFSFLNIPNGICTYDEKRNGTCMEGSECRSANGDYSSTNDCGIYQGTNIGICCLMQNTCGGTAPSKNNSYFANPDFPDNTNQSQSCALIVPVGNACFIRLDLHNFTMHDPVNGSCVVDQFFVPELTESVPMICGYNNRSHMYLSVKGLTQITLQINLGEWSGNRQWLINIARIKCGADWAPESGCLQQYLEPSDTLYSFNYNEIEPEKSALIAGLDYTVCIRRAATRCYARWSSDFFHLSPPKNETQKNKTALVGNECRDNFVLIDGGYDLSDRRSTFDRYCGEVLSAIPKSPNSSNVYTASFPFHIRVHTSRRYSTLKKGFVLNYAQLQCLQAPVLGVRVRDNDPLAWLEKFKIW